MQYEKFFCKIESKANSKFIQFIMQRKTFVEKNYSKLFVICFCFNSYFIAFIKVTDPSQKLYVKRGLNRNATRRFCQPTQVRLTGQTLGVKKFPKRYVLPTTAK